ncbi:hemolysin family protein [Candidatus Phytoplasma pini]|uniref:Hemolysin n=1 Tax=Candidatus Phytoplasma pini TaxID=267362 RepID=A0A559KJ46_9MOLU|nr:hemolysin family protein [Candidatus Phytoplasma pini]TVY12146.1 Hemolysin [Candidatus Phytoplasma pini]
MSQPLVILIILILILINSFLSAKEIAFVSLSENKINLEVKKGFKKALKIKKFKEKPSHFLTVIQIMVHILTFFQGIILNDHIISNKTMNSYFYFKYFIEITVIFISIVFGEIIPKRIALVFPLKTAYFLTSIFDLICFLVKPFFWFLNKISNLILYFLKIDINIKKDVVAEDELRFLLNVSYRKGIIDSNENNMIQNIFDFDGTIVSNIMCHRKSIVAIESDITKKELISFILKEKYTRFPVYEGNIDKIIGIIHVKDLIKGLLIENNSQQFCKEKFHDQKKKIAQINETEFQLDNIMSQNQNSNKFDIKHFLRKAYFVMEFKNISELFKEMQLTQNHIAIVVDEYGGTSGLVTIEDLIEEILGDIKDEYDKKNVDDILKISDKEYIIKGTSHLHEIEDHLKANLPIEEYDTLSGFMLSKFKKMPDKNTEIEIIYNDWKFIGLTHDGLVIDKIKVNKLNNDILSSKIKDN